MEWVAGYWGVCRYLIRYDGRSGAIRTLKPPISPVLCRRTLLPRASFAPIVIAWQSPCDFQLVKDLRNS
jgi:hypothetical protein